MPPSVVVTIRLLQDQSERNHLKQIAYELSGLGENGKMKWFSPNELNL